jgi:hypothetical protein
METTAKGGSPAVLVRQMALSLLLLALVAVLAAPAAVEHPRGGSSPSSTRM